MRGGPGIQTRRLDFTKIGGIVKCLGQHLTNGEILMNLGWAGAVLLPPEVVTDNHAFSPSPRMGDGCLDYSPSAWLLSTILSSQRKIPSMGLCLIRLGHPSGPK